VCFAGFAVGNCICLICLDKFYCSSHYFKLVEDRQYLWFAYTYLTQEYHNNDWEAYMYSYDNSEWN